MNSKDGSNIVTSSLHVNNNNDTNYINWYLNLDDNMKDLLMEAVLSGSQIYHCHCVPWLLYPSGNVTELPSFSFPAFGPLSVGWDIVLIKFRLFLYSFSEIWLWVFLGFFLFIILVSKAWLEILARCCTTQILVQDRPMSLQMSHQNYI